MPTRIAVTALLVLTLSCGEPTVSAPQVQTASDARAISEPSVIAPVSAPSPVPRNQLGGNALEEPMAVGGEVTAPIIVKRVEPEWPEVVTRDVFWLFSAVITKDGRVRDLTLVKGKPGLYSRAAEEAINQWQFKPGTYRGNPVEVKYDVSVRIHVR